MMYFTCKFQKEASQILGEAKIASPMKIDKKHQLFFWCSVSPTLYNDPTNGASPKKICGIRLLKFHHHNLQRKNKV